MVIKCGNPKFWSIEDEMSFFNWAKKIKTIKLEYTKQWHIVPKNNTKPTKKDLKELVALCKRYKVNRREIEKLNKYLRNNNK